MQQRVFYGLVAVSLLFLVAAADALLAIEYPAGWPLARLIARGSTLPLTFAALVLAGGFEMLRLLRTVGLRPHARIGLILSVVMVLSPWLCAAGLLGRSPVDTEGQRWQLIWLIVLVVASGIAQLRRREMNGAIADLGATWLMVLYLGFGAGFAVQLRSNPDIPGETGAWLVLIVLLATKVSDIGGYLVGSWRGRHKLIPSVSPGKSIEGAIGGVLASGLFAVIVSRLYVSFCPFAPPESRYLLAVESMTQAVRGLALWQAIVFGMLMSISAQVGDLLESAFKRAAHQKDSAALVPGFGGVLDLIDSPIVACPIAWVLLTVWWKAV